jgi:hypothetical protein
MQVIYKYIVDSQSMHQHIFAVTLPLEAKVLTVQKQGENTCMWVLQNLQGNGPFQERRFVKIGTGQPVAENYKYIGTVQEMGGALIWHYFEVL